MPKRKKPYLTKVSRNPPGWRCSLCGTGFEQDRQLVLSLFEKHVLDKHKARVTKQSAPDNS
jgi:hypothetical protein